MPRVPPPSFSLRFAGRRDYPPEQEIDDWGLSPSQQESYVEQFRRALESKNAWREDVHDYYVLRRFLRARSYDLEKATKMWMDTTAWRAQNGADTILQDFDFPERETFLKYFPQGYHKVDKVGRPVYIQMVGKIQFKELQGVTDEERMIKFHIQEYERCLKVIFPVCSKAARRNIDQTLGVIDVKGVGMAHLTGDVKRLMGRIMKIDQDNYPETAGHICIINAPAVFRMIWAVVKGMIDVRTQAKIEILGPNYLEALTKWIDVENIPTLLGGKSQGTLFDDVGPWSNQDILNSLNIDVEGLRAGRRPLLLHTPTFGRTSSRDDTGFHTPTGASGNLAPNRSSSANHSGSHVVDAIATNDQLPPITEMRAKTLIERVTAVERMLPQHMDRLRPIIRQTEAREAMSTRSAPEGSLLHRVETIEEALEILLAAQELSLEQQRAHEEAMLVAHQERSKARACCGCVVM